MIKENKLLKDFKLPSSNGKEFHLKKELKQNLIIYVYPKDNTPGCTTESIEFAKHYKTLKKLKTEVIGISKDSIESHIKFKEKFKFPWFDGWQGFTGVRFNKYKETRKMALHADHIHTMFDGERKGIPILSVLSTLNEDYKGGDFVLFDKHKIKLTLIKFISRLSKL